MDKNRLGHVIIVITVAILFTVFLLIMIPAFNREQPQIVLPDEENVSESTDHSNEGDSEQLVARVEVTPDTVQAVVATLDRPKDYMAKMTLTTFWSGGEGRTTVAAYVTGPYMRTDMRLPSGQVKHMIRDEEQTYIWYNQKKSIYTVENGEFSGDEDQWLPTYEDLLALDTDSVLKAEYKNYQETPCIFAEVRGALEGYTERYWISVDNGLLVAAERLQADQIVYRMEATEVTIGNPESAFFVLPDGRELLKN